MEQRKIIFYELNEVPFRIFDHFSGFPQMSAIYKQAERSRRYETYAEDTGHLSPWVTWPTLHRGVTNEQHAISDFGMNVDHVDKVFPPIWKILARAGVKVGVFGSLHSYPLPENVAEYSFFVPDTFAAGPECFPAKYEAFQDFNLAMVGLNGMQVSTSLAFKQAARFLAAAPGLGLRGRTLGKLAGQLVSERLSANRTVRRRTSQAQIAFDFYLQALRESKPDISFFFTNHVASSMHRYWPALFPDDYKTERFENDWIREWGGEIPFAMREANAQLALLQNFVERNPGYLLVVATSMGQAPVENPIGMERSVIVSSLTKLMAGLKIDKEYWKKLPAMVPQSNVWVSDAAKERFLQNLRRLTVNRTSICATELGDGVVRIELGLPNQYVESVSYDGQLVNPDTFGIACLEMMDATGANAYHIPNGMLLVYDPTELRLHSEEPKLISTVEVAPSILRNFGVAIPPYMTASLSL